MKTKVLYFFLILFALVSCSKSDEEDNNGKVIQNVNANVVTTQKEVTRLEFPRLTQGGNNIVIIHKTRDTYDPDGVNYSLEWDCDKKSQRWVCYQMHKYSGGGTGRTEAWAEDPDIPSYARFSDTRSMYSGSGYDRGHICPSADRQYSYQANAQTFYYSNMQPQFRNFNAGNNSDGVWVRMESQLRTWVATSGYDTVYVCKGGTIRDDQILAYIRPNVEGGLIVPKYFFMALLCKNSQGYKALGFWAQHNNNVGYTFWETEFNKDSSKISLSDFVINIRELENRTGIDFFCNLPDDIENRVENLNVDNVKRAWGLK
jgi:endonuclease G